MENRLDEAIMLFVKDQSDHSLWSLNMAFLAGTLLVPVAQPVKELQPGHYDVLVICVRTETGAGAIPAFTALEHLFKWEPQGCLYTSLTGRSLLTMAVGMESISEILVNPNDVPRGRIPRTDFETMLSLQ